MRPPPHIQPTRQNPLGRYPARRAVHHHAPKPENPGPHALLLRGPRGGRRPVNPRRLQQSHLICHDQFGDGQPMLRGGCQQLRAAPERIRHHTPSGLVRGRRELFRRDDKAAPNRIEDALPQHLTRGVEGHEAHPVRMRRHTRVGIHLVAPEKQVFRLLKRHSMAPHHSQPACRPDLRQRDFDRCRVNLIRCLAQKPEQHGAVGRVAHAGKRQRAVELHPHTSRPLQRTRNVQLTYKAQRSPHRPHRMGARRANADLEQFKEARIHV